MERVCEKTLWQMGLIVIALCVGCSWERASNVSEDRIQWGSETRDYLSYEEYFSQQRLYDYAEDVFSGWSLQDADISYDGTVLRLTDSKGTPMRDIATLKGYLFQTADKSWIYGISEASELVRVSYSGKIETLFADRTGLLRSLAEKEHAPIYLADGCTLFFLAGTDEGIGIYRLYLPNKQADVLYSSIPRNALRLRLEPPPSNVEAVWDTGDVLFFARYEELLNTSSGYAPETMGEDECIGMLELDEKRYSAQAHYDRPHQITCNEAAQIHCFSKKIAQLIWEFNPSEGTVDCERYEPIANKIVEQNGTTGLRDLLIGQYFMEGKNGTQLLFVHRSMYEYFIALSFYDHIARLVSSGFTPKELYQEVSFDGGPNKLTQFTNLLGMQNLSSFPDIQGHLSQMLKKSPLGTLGWWHEFFSQFLNFGLANAAWGRSKSGVSGLSEELTRFYNLLWLVKEQLSSLGESAPFALCKNLEKSIYFRIPYDSQKDLQDLILDGIKLPCQNFCGARLRRLHMAESILSYADFSEASLNFANFRSSKMEQCDFSRADLTGADLSLANLEHSQFDSAILSHTNFRGANLTGAHFSYANLSHADFSEAILDGAIFTNATIENAIFDKASMQRVNLNHQSIKSTSFKSAILTESSLEGIHVSDNTSMQNAIMTSCNLSYSDFEKINLAFVTFENAQILSAYLCGCNLQGANLSQADLSDSHLRHADLNNSILRKAILDNADISGADLTNADLRGAYLTHTTLYHANLYKVKADQHMFNSAIFDSDDWTHWEIEYPNITNSNEASQVENTSILADLDWIPGDDGSRINWCELKIYEKLCTDFEESDKPYE